jgi:RNA polymerase sigma-70 factor (TIGR02960 family)
MTAWRGLAGLEGHTSVRSWWYRIAASRKPRGLAPRPVPEDRVQPLWLEPYPDEGLTFPVGPEARYGASEGISLGFVSAIQYLPPLQRAALVLRDVLGFPAAEAADILDCSLENVENLLNRARANLPPSGSERPPAAGSPEEIALVKRFITAYEREDIAEIIALLTKNATLTIPPLPFIFRGHRKIGDFLASVFGTRRFKLVPTRANGQPAFGCYLRDPTAPIARSQGMIVLTLSGEQITQITRFMDNGVLPRFGLPRILPEYITDPASSEGPRNEVGLLVRPGVFPCRPSCSCVLSLETAWSSASASAKSAPNWAHAHHQVKIFAA